jgi:cytochrome P450
MAGTRPNPSAAVLALPVVRGQLQQFARDPLGCMRRLFRLCGPTAALEEEGRRLIFVFGPELNRRLLSDPKTYHSQFFAIRGHRNSAQRRLTNALLGMNGSEHKRHRRLVMGPFQKESMVRYGGALAELAERLLCDWQPGQVRDIFRDMARHMLRVASSLLFGFDRPELAYEIGRHIERWVAMNHRLGMGAFISDDRDASDYDELLALADALEGKIRAMIEYRRSASALGQDVLSLLLCGRQQMGNGLSDAELIGQAAILFAAAHLTTANTLAWTLFLLAQHPRVALELADELSAVLHGETPTLAQLERLPALDRIVKESMRILPASCYVQRVTTQAVALGPWHLPVGTVVFFSQYITHHMPALFPEPERFCPDRWRAIRPSPYAYLPFGAGPRMCLGGPVALLTIKITLAAIWQRYHMSVAPGARIDGRVRATMLAPAAGIPMLISAPTTPFREVAVEGNIHEMVMLGDRLTATINPAHRIRS